MIQKMCNATPIESFMKYCDKTKCAGLLKACHIHPHVHISYHNIIHLKNVQRDNVKPHKKILKWLKSLMHAKELTVFVGEVDGEESGVIRLRIISIGEITETRLRCCSGVAAALL